MKDSLNNLLHIAESRYMKAKRFTPLLPESRILLFGNEEDLILGTYDHLRSPFSNRLITADWRISELNFKLGVRVISLCLDVSLKPSDTVRGTRRGDQIGLSVFSKKLAAIDCIYKEHDKYLINRKSSMEISIKPESLRRYLFDPVVSFLRSSSGRTKKEILDTAELFNERASRVVALYDETAKKAENENISHSQGLLLIRGNMWNLMGLDNLEVNVRRILLSELLIKISDALVLMQRTPWFKKFIENCSARNLRLMERIDCEGNHIGSVYYKDADNGFIVLHNGKQQIIERGLNWTRVCTYVRDGLASPTTALLYLLFHIGAGYFHFGNSYKLNELLCQMIGISPRLEVNLTDDGANSTPVSTIRLPLGVSENQQKNITIDALWFESNHYRGLCEQAIRTGKAACDLVFGHDLPEHN